jgi:hypothetical protein
MLSAETLELMLRPNLQGQRVSSRAFKRFWRPQKVSDRFTRARVDRPNFLFYILRFDVPSKHQAGSGTLGSSVGRSAGAADTSSKNRRLQSTAGDRVCKIVPLRVDKIMSYLCYKNVAKQRRIELNPEAARRSFEVFGARARAFRDGRH